MLPIVLCALDTGMSYRNEFVFGLEADNIFLPDSEILVFIGISRPLILTDSPPSTASNNSSNEIPGFSLYICKAL